MYLKKQQHCVFNLEIFKMPALFRVSSKHESQPHEVLNGSFTSQQMFGIKRLNMKLMMFDASHDVQHMIANICDITSRN